MPSAPETRSKVGGWPLAAAITVVLVFLFFVREILLPFILAAALAFILTPVVDEIERRLGIRRWIVAVVAYFVVVGLGGLLGYWVGGLVIRDVAEIARQLPQLVHKLVGDLAKATSDFTGQSLDADALTKALMAQLGAVFGGGAALKIASVGVTAIFSTILAVVLLIYFLVSGRQIARGVFWLIPPEYRREANRVTAKVLPMLWRYFVGLVGVVVYTTVVAWIGFGVVFHLPHAELLAIVVGLLELIPVIGPALSIGLVGLTAIQQSSLFAVMGLAVFAIALRISIDQLVGPLVLGRAAHIHPVVIIFSFLSGAVLFGIIGLLLAVPVAASIKIVLSIYYAEPVRDEKRGGAKPPPQAALRS